MSKTDMKKWVEETARKDGYAPCPDPELFENLIDGLITNLERYGYKACPCRISSGNKTYDSDIICPCEYRDADVTEYGMCYCGLYVDKKVAEDPGLMQPIPERRPIEIQDAAMQAEEQTEKQNTATTESSEKIVVYRCRVCGYLAARENPPPICPICKAKAERFEKFDLQR